jgi:hypothetical protein
MAAFVVYYLSVRNEPTVTPTRFDYIIRTKLRRMKLSSQIKTYIQYRLAEIWPLNSAGVAAVLQVEQTTSIIDLYETFIRVAQNLLSRGCSPATTQALVNGLAHLTPITDFRLAHLRLLLHPEEHNLSLRLDLSHRSSDLLLTGAISGALRTALRSLKIDPLNLNELIVASICLSCRSTLISASTRINKIALERLSVIFSKTGEFDRAASELFRLIPILTMDDRCSPSRVAQWT